MTRTIVTVPSSASLARLRRTAAAHPESQWILVAERGFVVGVAARGDIPAGSSEGKYRRGFAAKLMQQYSMGGENESVFDVAARMRSEGTSVALVAASQHSSVKAADVQGVLGREHMGDIVDQYVDFYSGRQE